MATIRHIHGFTKRKVFIDDRLSYYLEYYVKLGEIIGMQAHSSVV